MGRYRRVVGVMLAVVLAGSMTFMPSTEAESLSLQDFMAAALIEAAGHGHRELRLVDFGSSSCGERWPRWGATFQDSEHRFIHVMFTGKGFREGNWRSTQVAEHARFDVKDLGTAPRLFPYLDPFELDYSPLPPSSCRVSTFSLVHLGGEPVWVLQGNGTVEAKRATDLRSIPLNPRDLDMTFLEALALARPAAGPKSQLAAAVGMEFGWQQWPPHGRFTDATPPLPEGVDPAYFDGYAPIWRLLFLRAGGNSILVDVAYDGTVSTTEMADRKVAKVIADGAEDFVDSPAAVAAMNCTRRMGFSYDLDASLHEWSFSEMSGDAIEDYGRVDARTGEVWINPSSPCRWPVA